ncbi:hypothetical protein TNCV_2381741 [Trichonephila clavipes]|nr:hypothetical protein TNCV_2381741 [Trichonephila clavipes]
MFDPSPFANPTPLAHADTSRDALPRGGTSQPWMKHESITSHPRQKNNQYNGLKRENRLQRRRRPFHLQASAHIASMYPETPTRQESSQDETFIKQFTENSERLACN